MSRVLSDRYVLDEVIGAGGAATVYRGVDRALDRPVAVKLLAGGVARSADPGGRHRFLQEATSAARFQHPNLVTVYDAGDDGGDLFLVMEYVAGRTLADVIAERAPLPVGEATSIATQILRGLAAVHEHGTIHRDVKPANVLVGSDGRVRLTDFGIAKRLGDIEDAVTAVGSLVGTPQYLAPEQAVGAPLSPATDLYQVGLVLHEMLTGERAGGALPALAATAEAVDPRGVRDGIPDPVGEAVVRATQREPARRFASADDMAAALTVPGLPSASSDVAAGPPVPGLGHTRTLALPIAVGTTLLPADEGLGGPATRVTTATVPPPPATGGRRRRPTTRRSGAAVAALIGVLTVGALAVGMWGLADGDRSEDLVVPGNGSTVPPATVSTPDPATITTDPPPDAAPAAGGEARDRPGNGGERGNGNGKKKKD